VRHSTNKLLAYVAFNPKAGRNEWVIGPRQIAQFMAEERKFFGIASGIAYPLAGDMPAYKASSAKVMTRFARGDVGGAVHALASAWRQALSDGPGFWVEAAVSTTAIAAGTGTLARGVAGEATAGEAGATVAEPVATAESATAAESTTVADQGATAAKPTAASERSTIAAKPAPAITQTRPPSEIANNLIAKHLGSVRAALPELNAMALTQGEAAEAVEAMFRASGRNVANRIQMPNGDLVLTSRRPGLGQPVNIVTRQGQVSFATATLSNSGNMLAPMSISDLAPE
jgi:hypothetical protein